MNSEGKVLRDLVSAKAVTMSLSGKPMSGGECLGGRCLHSDNGQRKWPKDAEEGDELTSRFLSPGVEEQTQDKSDEEER